MGTLVSASYAAFIRKKNAETDERLMEAVETVKAQPGPQTAGQRLFIDSIEFALKKAHSRPEL